MAKQISRRVRPAGRPPIVWSTAEFDLGLGKIDYNRYSISIFFILLSSKIPITLLFWVVIEYAFFFTFCFSIYANLPL